MRFKAFLTAAVALLLLNGCASANSSIPSPLPLARPIATLRPTISLPTSAPAVVAEDPVDTGWVTGTSGIEFRKLRVDLGDRKASISVTRLNFTAVRLRVGYAPEQPKPLESWVKQTNALLVVNGSFFDQSYRSTALLVSDGVATGKSYQGFGGMFGVTASGEASIQPLRDQPYEPAQQLDQALQSFPMLVFPGGTDPGVQWNDERDRRTALATDRDGRLLVIVCSTASFSLNEFATWLRTSDLAIDRALNLDGGASTGLYVNAGAAQERIEAFSSLPIVLYAVPKQ